MELPIRIMVTLFVVLLVGSTLIVFSKEVINNAKNDLEANRNTDIEDEEKIIQLNELDERQLENLMIECYNRYHGNTFEKEQCFAVIAKTGNWQKANIETYFTSGSYMDANITFVDVNDNDYAVGIYFDPYGASETIEVSK